MENLLDILEMLEEFTCKLNGSKKTSDIKVLRYLLFCAKRGEVELYQLPSCQQCLRKHMLRANYQTYISKIAFLHALSFLRLVEMVGSVKNRINFPLTG